MEKTTKRKVELSIQAIVFTLGEIKEKVEFIEVCLEKVQSFVKNDEGVGG